MIDDVKKDVRPCETDVGSVAKARSRYYKRLRFIYMYIGSNYPISTIVKPVEAVTSYSGTVTMPDCCRRTKMSKFIDRIKQNQIPYIHTCDLFTGVPGTTLYRPYRGTDGVPSALRDQLSVHLVY